MYQCPASLVVAYSKLGMYQGKENWLARASADGLGRCFVMMMSFKHKQKIGYIYYIKKLFNNIKNEHFSASFQDKRNNLILQPFESENNFQQHCSHAWDFSRVSSAYHPCTVFPIQSSCVSMRTPS